MNHRTRNNKRYEENDWFHIIDKNYKSLQLKYNSLEKQKIQISKDSFVLSLIENSNDKKKYDIIKDQMEKVERNELNNLKNNIHSINNNKSGFIFPNINISNYKYYKPKNTYISSNEYETMNKLLSKFDKKNNKKIIEQYTHKKIIPKGFNLSHTKTNYNSFTLSTDETEDFQINSKSYRKYQKPNLYYKPYLNNTLFNVLLKANKEEEEFEKTGIDIIQNLKQNHFKKNNNERIYKTEINLKKNKPKIISNKNKILENKYNFPIINKIILKGKKDYFKIAKEKMYDIYLQNIKGEKKKLISSRRNSEDKEEKK
jgi:hypothetical protein